MKVSEIITNEFIEGLKRGNLPWKAGWMKAWPQNFTTKTRYSGINVLMLSRSKEKKGFKYNAWASMKQINGAGGSVNAGSKASMAIFYKLLDTTKTRTRADGTQKIEAGQIPMLRYYNIFNIQQTTLYGDYDEKHAGAVEVKEDAEKILHNRQPNIFWDSNEAYFIPEKDEIHLPSQAQFTNTESYYETAFHELTHWSGGKGRLEREIVGISHNEKSYSKEELVACIGSAFLLARTNLLTDQVKENSQAYINGWISHLESNPNHIISAASAAQKATDYLLEGVSHE